jgi:hypothetical protein
VEFSSWLLVVSIVREYTGFSVQYVRPIWIDLRRRQEHEAEFTTIPKTSLIARSEKSGEWIISRVAASPPLIYSVDVQVRVGECTGRDDMHGSRWQRTVRACGSRLREKNGAAEAAIYLTTFSATRHNESGCTDRLRHRGNMCKSNALVR